MFESNSKEMIRCVLDDGIILLIIAPAFSKVRYRGSTFRPFVRSFVRSSVRPSVRPSTICVESRKFTSSLGINFISLQQW